MLRAPLSQLKRLRMKVEAYTDGACKGNPGPGGWGVLLKYGDTEKELFGGVAATTNNRMELIALPNGFPDGKLEAGERLIRSRSKISNFGKRLSRKSLAIRSIGNGLEDIRDIWVMSEPMH